MIELPWTLPKDMKSLQQLAHDLMSENIRLAEENKLLKRKQFGSSSEKGSNLPPPLFNEVESVSDSSPEDQQEDAKTEVKPHLRGKPVRKPLPDNLPRIRREFDLSEHDKICKCGCQMVHIGEETSEQLDIIPARFQVIQNVRLKYACRSCESYLKLAEAPAQAIPKSMASGGLLAYCAISKYQDALPLYRQEQIFTRLGVEINRATIASWMIRVGHMLTPIINLMQEHILSGSVLHMDETSVQVLKGTGKRPQTKNYMWIIHGGPPGQKATVFIYDPSRSKLVPEKVLADFCGYLMVDGYKSYDSVSLKTDIIRLGCWAHVRRKFDDAEKTAIGGKASTQRQSAATKAKELIAKLYVLEKDSRDLPDDERLSIRQKLSKPIVDQFFEYVHSMLSKVPPKSLLGKAMNYAASNQHLLIRFLDNSCLPLDNNAAENAIRPFAVGRKNWLFSDTVKGADASANIYSVIESAKLAGHIPYFYLRMLMEELPKAQTLADLEALLPYNIKPMDRVLH